MNNRLIKAYIEMKNSQNKNTPSVKTESNPKKLALVKKHCRKTNNVVDSNLTK